MEMKIQCAHDDILPTKDLKAKFHPKNRNDHPDDQIERLAKIMAYQGVRWPVKVSNRSGFITAGHGRVLAAQKNKWQKFPVDYQDYETEEQEYADLQSDNAIASWSELDLSGINQDIIDLGPVFDLDLLGIKDFVLEPAEKFEPQADEDDVPEAVEPKTKPGDIYQLGRHRLMCGDSTNVQQVEALMAGNVAEALVSDPPYGIDYQSNHRKDKFDKLRNDDVVLSEWVGCAETFVSGWIIFFIGWQRMGEWLEVGKSFGDLTNILIWKKAAAMGDLKGAFSPTYEMALAYNRGSKLSGSKRPSAILECNIDSAETFKHPTQKPIKIFEMILDAIPSQSVLDLFGGSGSTLIACEKTNRKCFMMELDPHYCDVIVARWEKYTGQKAELTNG